MDDLDEGEFLLDGAASFNNSPGQHQQRERGQRQGSNHQLKLSSFRKLRFLFSVAAVLLLLIVVSSLRGESQSTAQSSDGLSNVSSSKNGSLHDGEKDELSPESVDSPSKWNTDEPAIVKANSISNNDTSNDDDPSDGSMGSLDQNEGNRSEVASTNHT